MASRTAVELKEWIKEHRITEVECLVPDMAGIPRGKILPAAKFLATIDSGTLRLPDSVFGQMVTGAHAETEQTTYQSPDMVLKPDAETIRVVPWYQEPTAQVICDCYDREGRPVGVAPRQVLKNILAKYAARGWKPVVAPELEFYLSQKNLDQRLKSDRPDVKRILGVEGNYGQQLGLTNDWVARIVKHVVVPLSLQQC